MSSFFQELLQEPGMDWHKCKIEEIDPQTVLFSGKLCMNTTTHPCQCFVLPGRIIRVLKEERADALNFDYATLKVINDSGQEPYGLTLTRGGKTHFFTFPLDCYTDRLYLALRKHCIQEDFARNYEVCEKLGRGAYSVVWKGIARKTFKTVAIKKINKKELKKKVSLSRSLKEEIDVLKRIDHPTIVKLLETYEDQDFVYLIFEYIQGGDLSQKLSKEGEYTERGALCICQEVLKGISYLHKEGIMHRDLKPANVLLVSRSRETKVKIADFGFAAKLQGPKKLSYRKCGTPGFIAPEMFKSSGYNEKVDIFSIGAILYTLQGGFSSSLRLSGVKPFQGATMKEILNNNKENWYSFEGNDWKNINEASIGSKTITIAKDLISKMMKKNPVKRYTADQALQHPAFKILENYGLPTEKAALNIAKLLRDNKAKKEEGVFSHRDLTTFCLEAVDSFSYDCTPCPEEKKGKTKKSVFCPGLETPATALTSRMDENKTPELKALVEKRPQLRLSKTCLLGKNWLAEELNLAQVRKEGEGKEEGDGEVETSIPDEEGIEDNLELFATQYSKNESIFRVAKKKQLASVLI